MADMSQHWLSQSGFHLGMRADKQRIEAAAALSSTSLVLRNERGSKIDEAQVDEIESTIGTMR